MNRLHLCVCELLVLPPVRRSSGGPALRLACSTAWVAAVLCASVASGAAPPPALLQEPVKGGLHSAAASPVAAGAVRASFTPLGDLPGGGFLSSATALSADGGTVVGWSQVSSEAASSDPGPALASGPDGQPSAALLTAFEAFRWTAAEGMIGLGDVDESFIFSIARDVSADGAVIVGAGSLGQSQSLAVSFTWTAGTGIVALQEPSMVLSNFLVLAVSDDATTLAGMTFPPAGGSLAALWTPSTGVIELGALPNNLGFPDAYASDLSSNGTVACGQSFGEFVQPIRWAAETGLVGLGDAPGGNPYALGEGISADGTTIVGGARTLFDGGSRDEAFIWTASSGFHFLDPLRGQRFGSTAYAASADGGIVVGRADHVGAMVWDAQHGMRGVQQVLQSLGVDLTGWTLTTANDVSADGATIAGDGINPAGDPEAWIAHIPQLQGAPIPATSPTMLLVFAGLLLAAAAQMLRRTRCGTQGTQAAV